MATFIRAPVRTAGLSAPRRILPSTSRPTFATVGRTNTRPAELRSEFVSAFSGITSLCASLAGMALGPVRRWTSTGPASKPFIVEANAKKSMGCTLHGSRRKKVGVSGFRSRSETPGGRKVLQARRKKGRKNLCPAKMYRKGKGANQ